jgi:hypothetical protein
MSNIIKNFSDFHDSSNRMNEAGVGDFITGLFSRAGGALTDVLKSKIASYLYEWVGVPEGSFLGTIIEKVAQQIDFAEYGDFLTGGSIPVEKFAPKLADATIETLVTMGVRPTAQKLKVEDTNGLIYRTIEEMITNETKKKEFHDVLTGLYSWMLGGGSPTGGKKNSLFQPIVKDKSGNPKSMFNFTPEEQKKIATDPAVKSATQGGALRVEDILANITGGAGAKTPIPGA